MPTYPGIFTTRGMILVDEKSMQARLVFYSDVLLGIKGKGFGGAKSAGRWGRRFYASQWFLDNEILSTCDPYIPFLTGMLRLSGILGTKVGSGMVSWIAPYAAAQYYMVRVNPSQTGPLRGPFWFQRMWETYGQAIIAGAKKIFRDKGK